MGAAISYTLQLRLNVLSIMNSNPFVQDVVKDMKWKVKSEIKNKSNSARFFGDWCCFFFPNLQFSSGDHCSLSLSLTLTNTPMWRPTGMQ